MIPTADTGWPVRRTGPSRLAARSLAADRAVLAASAASVAVTVALAASALFAAAGIRAAERDSLASGLSGVPLVVRGQGGGAGTVIGGTLAVPEVAVGQAATVPGVAWAEGDVVGYARVEGSDGRGIGSLGEPAIGMSIGRSSPIGALTVVRGHLPAGSGQMVVDPSTFAAGRLRMGQRVTVAFAGGIGRYTLVGEILPAGSGGVTGATLAGFDLGGARQAFGMAGSVDQVEVGLVPGADPARLSAAVAAAVGPGLEVVTGRTAAADLVGAAARDLSFVPLALAALAAGALVVALVVTADATSLLAARRRHDLAVTRLLGAPQWWAVAVPAGAAAATGLAASAVGTAVALLALPAVGRLAAAAGVGVPIAPGATPLTVAAAVALGPVVAVVAAILPARRAAHRAPGAGPSPVAGPAGGGTGPGHRGVGRLALPAAAVAAGGMVMAAAAAGDVPPPVALPGRLALVGAGAGLVLAGALAGLTRLAAVPGRGRAGSRRSGTPRALGWRHARAAGGRSASAAAVVAVAVGVLVTVVTLAASVRTTVARTVGGMRADLVAVSSRLEPFPASVLQQPPRPAALASVVPVHVGAIVAGGASRRVYGVDPAGWRRMVASRVLSGSIGALSGGGVAVSATFAAATGVRAGGSLPVVSARAGPVSVPVRAVYADDPVAGDLVMPLATFTDLVPDEGVLFVLATAAPGASPAAARSALAGMVAGAPQVDVLSRSAFVGLASGAVDRGEAALAALAGAASVGALAGVAEAMVVSVLARRRELRLLWAVGMPPAGLRATVRWEVLSLAALGTALGTAIGVPVGWAVLAVLVPGGPGVPSLPLGALGLLVAASLAVAAVAAEVPARWAGRVACRSPGVPSG